jgi:hypothetical protein
MSANTSITMYEKQSKKFYGQLYVQTQLKDQRMQPERGGECEPIKIPYRNSTYILNLTRRPSLLTHHDHIAIERLLFFGIGLVTRAEI